MLRKDTRRGWKCQAFVMCNRLPSDRAEVSFPRANPPLEALIWIRARSVPDLSQILPRWCLDPCQISVRSNTDPPQMVSGKASSCIWHWPRSCRKGIFLPAVFGSQHNQSQTQMTSENSISPTIWHLSPHGNCQLWKLGQTVNCVLCSFKRRCQLCHLLATATCLRSGTQCPATGSTPRHLLWSYTCYDLERERERERETQQLANTDSILNVHL